MFLSSSLELYTKFPLENNLMEYPFPVGHLPKSILPLVVDVVGQKDLQGFLLYMQTLHAVLVEVLHWKLVESDLDLNFAFFPSFEDLTLLTITLLKCISLGTIQDFKDEAIPNFKIARPIIMSMIFSIALRFSIRYSSH